MHEPQAQHLRATLQALRDQAHNLRFSGIGMACTGALGLSRGNSYVALGILATSLYSIGNLVSSGPWSWQKGSAILLNGVNALGATAMLVRNFQASTQSTHTVSFTHG